VGPTEYAFDISGVTATTLTLGGSNGVAAIGALYFASTPAAAQITPRTPSQSRPGVFATVTLLTTISAYRATHTRTPSTHTSSEPVPMLATTGGPSLPASIPS
jgi:hypothetical protein